MFPAHMERAANSLISNLGFIPPDSQFRTAEVKDLNQLHRLRKEHPYLEQCQILSNSDAHYLEHIREPFLTLHTQGRTAENVIQALLAPGNRFKRY